MTDLPEQTRDPDATGPLPPIPDEAYDEDSVPIDPAGQDNGDGLPADEAALLDDDAEAAPRPYTEDDVTQDSGTVTL